MTTQTALCLRCGQSHYASTLRAIKGAFIAVVLICTAPLPRANEVTLCSQLPSGPGASLTTSTCNSDFVILFKSFTEAPSFLDVRIDLEPTTDGMPTIVIGQESVINMTDKVWTDFHVNSPDASLLFVTSWSLSHFQSCTSITATEIFCDGGGGVPVGDTFYIEFDLGTPLDQSLNYFNIRQEPTFSVPEPASLAITGCGLMVMGWGLGRRRIAAPAKSIEIERHRLHLAAA